MIEPEHHGIFPGCFPVGRLRQSISLFGLFLVAAFARPPVIGIVMGSRSDWATLERAAQMLDQFGVPHECEIVSAHRTPDKLTSYAKAAAARGLKVIIAGAGGAAHLPGMMAAQTHLPVLGVPVESSMLRGVDSLLSIVQMPAGIPGNRLFRKSLRWPRRWRRFL